MSKFLTFTKITEPFAETKYVSRTSPEARNISAVSEEMSARASETLECSQMDAERVTKVAGIVEQLHTSAKVLEEKTKGLEN